jgi:hypothetical protein
MTIIKIAPFTPTDCAILEEKRSDTAEFARFTKTIFDIKMPY